MTLDAEIARPVRRLTALPPELRCSSCQKLRAEIDELREELEAYKAYCDEAAGCQVNEIEEFEDIHFTEKEQRFVSALMKARPRYLAYDQIQGSLYWDKPEDKWPDVSVIKTYASKINKKLRLADKAFKIENVWGRGSRLIEVEPV